MTQPTTSDVGDAVVVALVRHAVGAILWIAWLVTRRPIAGSPSLISLVILLGLTSLYVLWVNKPLERALGPVYAKRSHWSGVFVLPSLFAIVMLVRELILTGRAAFGL